MADRNPRDEFVGFETFENLQNLEDFEDLPPACAVCEAMLPDAADGRLTEAEQRAFDKHVAACKECARELDAAQRGVAWLSMLKTQAPAPPESLLAKILAETSGASLAATSGAILGEASGAILAEASGASQPADRPLTAQIPVPAAASHVPSPRPTAPRSARTFPLRAPVGQWAALRKALRDTFSIESARATFQPRIAMTAAMAFFSIALTLSLTGVRLRDLRPSNFTASALQRSIADANASATRMFQNNRAVYQVESRLSDLRGDNAPRDPASDSR